MFLAVWGGFYHIHIVQSLSRIAQRNNFAAFSLFEQNHLLRFRIEQCGGDFSIIKTLNNSIFQVEELSSVCNLEVRKFNFAQYPAFVGQLFQYHFKAIITAVSKRSIYIISILKFRKYTANLRAFGYWTHRFDSPLIQRNYWNSIQMCDLLQADYLAQLVWHYSDFFGENRTACVEAPHWPLYFRSHTSW